MINFILLSLKEKKMGRFFFFFITKTWTIYFYFFNLTLGHSDAKVLIIALAEDGKGLNATF